MQQDISIKVVADCEARVQHSLRKQSRGWRRRPLVTLRTEYIKRV